MKEDVKLAKEQKSRIDPTRICRAVVLAKPETVHPIVSREGSTPPDCSQNVADGSLRLQ